MGTIFLRCLILYFVVVIAVRIMGKRQIGELQPAELVVTILISELAAMPMQDLDLPLLGGILPIFTLVLIELILSVLTLKNVKSRILFYGKPNVLVYKGKINQDEMHNSRVTIDDILETMRDKGIAKFSDVNYVILETNGHLSILPKGVVKPLTMKDMSIEPPPDSGIPTMIIIDGRVMSKNLKKMGLNETWLAKTLKSNQIKTTKEVFLLTVDDQNETYLVKKEDKR